MARRFDITPAAVSYSSSTERKNGKKRGLPFSDIVKPNELAPITV